MAGNQDMEERTLSKTYEPSAVEEKWARLWIDERLATPAEDAAGETFSMVIPPPNITGALHLGHALNTTLQDILARFKRMKGYSVLWLPGIDHAGIATQNVVERQLAAEGISRHELGREEFIKRVWKWKEESGGTILNQLKRLGATCDWTRLRFTMDPGLSAAVREVFTTLYREGLIYRGDYIINWCPRCHTALSDLEVQFDETGGKLYYLVYPLTDGSGAVKVATTRPETMLGDTAVAVNPGDPRFKGFIGKTITLPLIGREIPVIADETVSMEFGTGAVKITPAHDFNDFEMARRHGLPAVNVMDVDGAMNENAGEFAGLDRFAAREKVTEALSARGLLDRVEDYKLMLGSCYRCSTVVEPRLSRQWFVKIKPLAGPAIKAVEDGRIRFVPRNWENLYFDWMHNIRDWCISRQIWWGHRIPAWHCADCGHVTVAATDPEACEGCGGKAIEQDPDVLDTWFSSSLWPFSTLGWPEKTADLERFYPTSVLSTSFDIIFFWVARMIMMGLKFMNEEPFSEVYIHALIRDAEGRKMSKSSGNVIDPLVMMDRYGTDAVRFTLAVLAAQGRDIKISEDRIEGYRNFTNKLWNLARFTLMNVEPGVSFDGGWPGEGELGPADRWILTRRAVCVREVEKALGGYEFDAAARALYRFVWHELCDWYVEFAKADLRGEHGPGRKDACTRVLVGVLADTLKMLHPFMPFITEEIYGYLPVEKVKSIMTTPYPAPVPEFPEEAARMEVTMGVIRAVRNIRTEMNISPGVELDCEVFTEDERAAGALKGAGEYLRRLARVRDFEVMESGEPPSDAVSSIVSLPEWAGEAAGAALGGVEVFVPMKGLIDVDAEIKRLSRELDKVVCDLVAVEKKLSNENFVARAPAEVVEKERSRLESSREKKTRIEQSIERVKGLRG